MSDIMQAEMKKQGQKWPMVKLEDCCTVVGGATPKRDVPEYWSSSDVPWVTPKDVSNLSSSVLDDAPEYISNLGYKSCATYMLPKGSVLLTSRAPIGNVAIAGRDMCTNQGFKSLVPSEETDGGYLYHCMKYFSQRLQALGNGATFKEVSKKTVEEFEIPLPPLEEQKRIAAILDKADAIRRKRQQAIDLADEFLRSLFLDMFGDPVTNPKGWEVVTLGDVLVSIDSGNSPKCETRVAGDNEYGVLKLGAITTGEFISSENKAILANYKPNLKHEVKSGDLLFTRKNTSDLVAAVVLVEETREKLLLPDLVFRLCTKECVEKYFFWKLLSNTSMRSKVQALASGAAGSMPNISKANLKTVEIILPPFKDQVRFREICKKISFLKSYKKEFLELDLALFNSLSQKSFVGDI